MVDLNSFYHFIDNDVLIKRYKENPFGSMGYSYLLNFKSNIILKPAN